MSLQEPIIEIFSSLQGEGPYLGERHLFVRFQDCELSCKFCDTPLSFVENKFCRVEHPPFSKKYKHIPNPVSIGTLNSALQDFDERVLSVTGGEPLQKVPFLKNWLPTVRSRFRILLETAGIHFSQLSEIIELVDIISMDLKLPSATGMHPWWREHEAFLKVAKGKDIYVKTVISSETEEEHVLKAASLVSSIDPSIPFILQPASAFGRFRATPSFQQVAQWQILLQKSLRDVRVIPQMHKQMGIL